MAEATFLEAYRGPFIGILRWHQLDELWERVRARANRGWYLYKIGQTPPRTRLASSELLQAIGDLDHLLRRNHGEDYCGIVYVDDREEPSFLKIFDPNHLGVVCGIGREPVLPGWILSLSPPVDLDAALRDAPEPRPWWRLWGKR